MLRPITLTATYRFVLILYTIYHYTLCFFSLDRNERLFVSALIQTFSVEKMSFSLDSTRFLTLPLSSMFIPVVLSHRYLKFNHNFYIFRTLCRIVDTRHNNEHYILRSTTCRLINFLIIDLNNLIKINIVFTFHLFINVIVWH